MSDSEFDPYRKVNPELPHILAYTNMTDYLSHYLKIDDIKGILLEKKIISLKVFQQINHKLVSDGSVSAAELLLHTTLLTEPDRKIFHRFLKILRAYNQEHLAEKLEDEYYRILQMKGLRDERLERRRARQGRELPQSQLRTDSSEEEEEIGTGMQEGVYQSEMEVDNLPHEQGEASAEVTTHIDESGADLALAASSPGASIKLNFRNLKVNRDKKSTLGKGRYGTVYKGRYLGKTCAVKELNAQFKNDADMENCIQGDKEIQACRMIKHSAIVKFLGYAVDDADDDDEPTLFLLFDLVDGHNLNKVLHTRNRSLKIDYCLNEQNKYAIAIQIGEALVYIHGEGILHGDIKPANILLSKQPGGRILAKLCDLGLCKIKRGNQLYSTVGGPQGTPVYMAPEFIMCYGGDTKVKVDEKVDVYSFGATLYELYEEKYMRDMDTKEGIGQLKAAFDRNELPEELRAPQQQHLQIIARCVQPQPQERPSSAELLRDLRQLQRQFASQYATS